MEFILIIIYGLTLSFIFLYSLVQISLVINYLKDGKKEIKINGLSDEDLPIVTVQLPLYNERYVVERLIDSITQFDYPKDKLEIQVLDDSTDETISIVANKFGFNKPFLLLMDASTSKVLLAGCIDLPIIIILPYCS